MPILLGNMDYRVAERPKSTMNVTQVNDKKKRLGMGPKRMSMLDKKKDEGGLITKNTQY